MISSISASSKIRVSAGAVMAGASSEEAQAAAILSGLVILAGAFAAFNEHLLRDECLRATMLPSIAIPRTSIATCEHWTAEDLPVYASSSDPIVLPMENEDGIPLSQIYLRPIPFGMQDNELEDETSCLSRSVRAFGQSMVSTSEAFATTRSSRGRSSSQQPDEEEDPSRHGALENPTRIGERLAHLATSNISKPQESGPDESYSDRVRSLQSKKNSSSSASSSSTNNSVTTRKMYFYRTSKIQSQKADKFCLLAAPSSRELGSDIAHLLGVPVSTMDVSTYCQSSGLCALQNLLILPT
jgi:hypothetical protein